MKICVLGAGVVGLNSALEIQKQNRNAQVTIIAEKFNQETTSDGAAGLFQPLSNYKGPTMDIARKWMDDSHNYYSDLRETHPRSGVYSLSGYHVSNISPEICGNEFMKKCCIDYRFATEEERNQFGVSYKYGTFYTTMVIPCRKYLPWSMEKFQKDGGNIIKKRIYDVNELAADYDVVFNCTGLNSRYLFNDSEVVPIKGQIVQVEAPWLKNFCFSERETYIIPLGFDNVVTLGGTFEYENYSTAIDQFIIKSVIHRCTEILPRLRTCRIIRKWAGLRPYRPTIRVEVEVRDNLQIIHNYGHGGSGVTASPGTSIYAVYLFNNMHRASGSSKL